MISAGAPAEPTHRPDDGPDVIPVPPRIFDVAQLLLVLIEYAGFLGRAVALGAAWCGFATVAPYFGTADVPAIGVRIRIRRGLMRAVALYKVLAPRGQGGRA